MEIAFSLRTQQPGFDSWCSKEFFWILDVAEVNQQRCCLGQWTWWGLIRLIEPALDKKSSFIANLLFSDSREKLLKKIQPKVDEIVSSHRQSIRYSPKDFVQLLDSNVGRREILNYFVKISDEFQNFAHAVK